MEHSNSLSSSPSPTKPARFFTLQRKEKKKKHKDTPDAATLPRPNRQLGEFNKEEILPLVWEIRPIPDIIVDKAEEKKAVEDEYDQPRSPVPVLAQDSPTEGNNAEGPATSYLSPMKAGERRSDSGTSSLSASESEDEDYQRVPRPVSDSVYSDCASEPGRSQGEEEDEQEEAEYSTIEDPAVPRRTESLRPVPPSPVNTPELEAEYGTVDDFLDEPPAPPKRSESLRGRTKAPDNIPETSEENKRTSFIDRVKKLPRELTISRKRGSREVSPSYRGPSTPLTPAELFVRPSFGLVADGPDETNQAWFSQSGTGRFVVATYLKERTLAWESSDSPRRQIHLDSLISVASVNPTHTATSERATYCLEVAWFAEGEHGVQVLGAVNTIERDIWMRQILESATSCFTRSLTTLFTLAGWLYIKEGVSGEWQPCWMLLQRRRELVYCTEPHGALQEVDLRQARCIIPRRNGGREANARCVQLELQGRSLYLQGITERDTNRWGRNIRIAALQNGAELDQMQLTKDKVPVAVHKCVEFVSTYGTYTEGIYKKRCTSPSVSRLLEELRSHAWAAQVTPARFTEHEVSTALRRMFKQLPTPLIHSELVPQLCSLSNSCQGDLTDKARRYRQLLQQLPSIYYVTARRLIGHLYFLQLQRRYNLMTAELLAAAWARPLMRLHQKSSMGPSQTAAMTDMIKLFPHIFEVSQKELDIEIQINRIICPSAAGRRSSFEPKKESGDLKCFISLDKFGSENTRQVMLTPQKSASEICGELQRDSDYTLQEFVLEGALRRSLNPTEKVLEVVTRWCYWEEQDRKRNELVLAPCNLHSGAQQKSKTTAMRSEFQFADETNGSFKTHTFELNEGILSCYKNSKMSKKIREWKVENIVCYMGFEPKRDPHTRCSITFSSRHNQLTRSTNQPYFGCTLASDDLDKMQCWLSALSDPEPMTSSVRTVTSL